MDILQQLQRDLEGYLNAATPGTKLAVMQYVPVYVVRPRVTAAGELEDAVMITTAIEQALAGLQSKGGKAGLAVVLLMPEAAVPGELERIAGPFLEIEVVVRVIEEPLVNMSPDGVQIPCEQLAADLLACLHLWKPGALLRELRGSGKKALASVSLPDKPQQLAYDVTLLTRYQVPPLNSVEPVTISRSGALPTVTATLACADGGAAIYYTTDGSFPSANNEHAELYAAPVVITAACTIRAVAYLSGGLPSSVAEHTIS